MGYPNGCQTVDWAFIDLWGRLEVIASHSLADLFARDYHFRSSLLSCLELQDADIVAFFPFVICLLSNVAKLPRNDMSALEQSFRITLAWQTILIRCLQNKFSVRMCVSEPAVRQCS
jgi:hypothetical protein